MKIFLLTHERELLRATNTGSIALEYAKGIVERVIWERVNPNKTLSRLIENNAAVLLYSKLQSSTAAKVGASEETEPMAVSPVLLSVNIDDYDNVIIIDSTWQEATKIFNHTDYLKSAPQFTLKTKSNSLYKLRANQPKGGLCTIECIIEVLKIKGENKLAAELLSTFHQFNR